NSQHGLHIKFTADSPIDPGKMLLRVQQDSGRFRLTPDGNLSLLARDTDNQALIKDCIAFLDELIKDDAP
ncbi:MAG: hypothetical protein R8L58_06085, partial [Mariprofundaceae bacterium]